MQFQRVRNASLLTAAALLAVAVVPVAVAPAPLKVGADPDAIGFFAREGVKPEYAAFWAGPWNERAGWGYLGGLADRVADQGVMPLVHWYYWGSTISPRCVDHGCWGDGYWKSRAQWAADARHLADALHAGLQGRKGVLVLESEFNKNGIERHEPFDGYLAEHARIFRERAPELQLVVGFGNWKSEHWWRFDRAVAAVDQVGFQTMRGSTRDSPAAYDGAVDAIKDATVKLRAQFGKPVLLHDLALSSFWMPQWGHRQEREVQELFARAGELQRAGLVGVVYRGLDDSPTMTTKEYYGIGERHMGLRTAWGQWKPALDDWIRGVKAVRGSGSFGPVGDLTSPSSGSPGGDASFRPRSLGHNWWVDVQVDGPPVHRVDVRVDDGGWTNLPRTPWGTWAKSLHVPDGSRVQFRATGPEGTDHSGPYAWGEAVGFRPASRGNDWWVETRVSGPAVAKVEARVDDGGWVALGRTSWGSWARSLHADDGAAVQFRAWTSDGPSLSPTYRW